MYFMYVGTLVYSKLGGDTCLNCHFTVDLLRHLATFANICLHLFALKLHDKNNIPWFSSKFYYFRGSTCFVGQNQTRKLLRCWLVRIKHKCRYSVPALEEQ